jgi:thiamine pyrophosphokinase
MTGALVVGAAPEPGGEPYYAELLRAAALVVAADAAAEWCMRLGRTPDAAVGDFDSALPGAEERLGEAGVAVTLFRPDKDESDLDLALAETRRRGASAVTFAAVTTGRLDHTLAALGTIASAADLHAAIDEPSLAGWALGSRGVASLELDGPAGSLVSVFGVTRAVVSISGLRYSLDRQELRPMSSRGLSNELTGEPGRVTVAEGDVLVLAPGVPGARARRVSD